jgi:hypothetical protein
MGEKMTAGEIRVVSFTTEEYARFMLDTGEKSAVERVRRCPDLLTHESFRQAALEEGMSEAEVVGLLLERLE